ncbi:MAG: glycosyltransferase family 2 protein, partial [Chitinophagaceae bacterium]|nr:glycosyltransferase family 2 protein [Chitinophagaceae bacterium]
MMIREFNIKTAPPGVSAVIVTYNDAFYLRRTLKQLYWCNEIIIVDNFSTDNTLSVCREYNCKIFQRQFDSYGEQKGFGVRKASNNWTLIIDADEYLTPELAEEIQLELQNTRNCNGYLIPVSLVYREKEFRHGKESKKYFIKLFHKEYCEINGDKADEKISVPGTKRKLKSKILRFSFSNIYEGINKMNANSTYRAEIAVETGRKPPAFIYLAIPLYFWKYYLLDRNFMNGKNGFYWSVFNAFYLLAEYV